MFGIRETTMELYGLDPKTFIGLPYEQVQKMKIDACWDRKEILNKELRGFSNTDNYEIAQATSYRIKRLEKARVAMTADYEEMGFRYARN